ncbi:TetR family transcriptional regulator [Aeromicrobium sp. 636]|uniref:TetR family transcriptional regulator n=1 Tax=Aeromicrobium senzhongii TaxID=2663859 RepID=A0A8I0JZ33_9ACTN|nr:MULTISPECIES: TetR family transcriptional regulator [Aeromicrobium]MBC9225532.1 TetR family transcriptional regulator [Aeromicrobium senzhongii]MCQ3997642.1 TetR family transcriptional regulator [Aeromicrobium sp. 636]MTB87569.1 TetR family transcriptional regulator [Aeromicrobium senzhongii]QNL95390.1 TetR family transcriptional regulator [Aeromicrobium senzhongii]
MSEAVSARQQQKERTRAALLDAALELSSEQGFAQTSLRQVAKRAGVVPAAFYRHFASMDELGLALVERCFGTLRTMIRDASRDPQVFLQIIDAAAEILVDAVKQNKADFAFVARERVGGSEVVRRAIGHELDLFVSELAVVLARLPNIETWSADDVQMVSRLFVRNMVANAEEVVEMPEGRPDLEERIREGARRQMRLIVLGFEDWRS